MNNKIKVCPNCGLELAEDAEKCSVCGTSVKAIDASKDAPTHTPAAPQATAGNPTVTSTSGQQSDAALSGANNYRPAGSAQSSSYQNRASNNPAAPVGNTAYRTPVNNGGQVPTNNVSYQNAAHAPVNNVTYRNPGATPGNNVAYANPANNPAYNMGANNPYQQPVNGPANPALLAEIDQRLRILDQKQDEMMRNIDYKLKKHAKKRSWAIAILGILLGIVLIVAVILGVLLYIATSNFIEDGIDAVKSKIEDVALEDFISDDVIEDVVERLADRFDKEYDITFDR